MENSNPVNATEVKTQVDHYRNEVLRLLELILSHTDNNAYYHMSFHNDIRNFAERMARADKAFDKNYDDFLDFVYSFDEAAKRWVEVVPIMPDDYVIDAVSEALKSLRYAASQYLFNATIDALYPLDMVIHADNVRSLRL